MLLASLVAPPQQLGTPSALALQTRQTAGSHGRGQVLPRTADSLPLLSTWTNTFPCNITEWTEG